METNGIMIAWNGMIMDAAINAKNTLENGFLMISRFCLKEFNNTRMNGTI